MLDTGALKGESIWLPGLAAVGQPQPMATGNQSVRAGASCGTAWAAGTAVTVGASFSSAA